MALVLAKGQGQRRAFAQCRQYPTSFDMTKIELSPGRFGLLWPGHDQFKIEPNAQALPEPRRPPSQLPPDISPEAGYGDGSRPRQSLRLFTTPPVSPPASSQSTTTR